MAPEQQIYFPTFTDAGFTFLSPEGSLVFPSFPSPPPGGTKGDSVLDDVLVGVALDVLESVPVDNLVLPADGRVLASLLTLDGAGGLLCLLTGVATAILVGVGVPVEALDGRGLLLEGCGVTWCTKENN